MPVYGEVALRAWSLASAGGTSPPAAWKQALEERFTEPKQLQNAIRHTCPKGAFLGLCQHGLVKGVKKGWYTNSTSSSSFALMTVALLREAPSLAHDKPALKARVFGGRTPNGEVDVVLALWENGIVQAAVVDE